MLEKGSELTQVVVDPDWETADADIDNNSYPRKIIPSRIEAYKEERSGFSNRDIMEDIKTEIKEDEDEDDETTGSDQ